MTNNVPQILLMALLSTVLTSVVAGPDPIPITANQAFDAVATGTDPVTGVGYGAGKIVIVDVRTPPEYQFQGTAGKVDSILLNGEKTPLVPDLGKAVLTQDGKYLEYTVNGKQERTAVEKIAELVTSPIAINIPCATWNEDTKKMDPAPERLKKSIERLADDGVQAVITMCNSGGRSTACVAKFIPEALASRFKAFYEIDRPGDQYSSSTQKVHLAGLGGFQGSVYNGVYNGYSGFPGRTTEVQPILGWEQGKPRGPSVSWKDSGLPIFIPETSCNLPDQPHTP